MIRLENPGIRIGLQASLPLQHKILLALVVVIAVVIIVIMYWIWRLRQFDKKRKTYQKVNFRELEICCLDVESKSGKIPLPHQPTRDQSDFYGSIDQRAIRFREALEKQLTIFEEKNEYRQRLEKTLSFKVDLSTDQLYLSEKFERMINDGKIYDDLNANMNRMRQALESAQNQLNALHNLEEEECQHVRDVGKEITTAQEHLQVLKGHSVLGIQAEFVQSVHDQVETTEENLGQAELLIAAAPSWEQVDQADDLCEKAFQKFKRLWEELDQFDRKKAKVEEARKAVSQLKGRAHKLEQESYGLLQAVQIEDEIDLDSQQQALEKAQRLLIQSRTDWSEAGDRARAVLRHCETKGVSYLEKLQESVHTFPYQRIAWEEGDVDELAIRLLLKEIKKGHQDDHSEVLLLQARLRENKEKQKRYISTRDDTTADRNQIIEQLNRVALKSTSLSFNEFIAEAKASAKRNGPISEDMKKRVSDVRDRLERYYASHVVISKMDTISDEIESAKRVYEDNIRHLQRRFRNGDERLPPSELIRASDSYRKKSIPCLERAGQLLDEVEQELKDFLNERKKLRDRLLEVRSESFEVLTRDQKRQAQKILDSVDVLEEELQGCDDPKKLKEIENRVKLIEDSVWEMIVEVKSKRGELQEQIVHYQRSLERKVWEKEELLIMFSNTKLLEDVDKKLGQYSVVQATSLGKLEGIKEELRDFYRDFANWCGLLENFVRHKSQVEDKWYSLMELLEYKYQIEQEIMTTRPELPLLLEHRIRQAKCAMGDLCSKEERIKEALMLDSFELITEYLDEAQEALKAIVELNEEIREDIENLEQYLWIEH